MPITANQTQTDQNLSQENTQIDDKQIEEEQMELEEENEENALEKESQQESQAQQSLLFDKSTVHTLKEELKEDNPNLKQELQSSRMKVTAHSENEDNQGIINIKTGSKNFKKSQSLRKTKGNTGKLKKIRIKKVSKRKTSKEQHGGKHARQSRRNDYQALHYPFKKSHSLDSMQLNMMPN